MLSVVLRVESWIELYTLMYSINIRNKRSAAKLIGIPRCGELCSSLGKELGTALTDTVVRICLL